jgi:hypothetical protein
MNKEQSMNVHTPSPADADWQTVKVPRRIFCGISTKSVQLSALLEILHADVEDTFDKTMREGSLRSLVAPQDYFDRTATALSFLADFAKEIKETVLAVELGEFSEGEDEE